MTGLSLLLRGRVLDEIAAPVVARDGQRSTEEQDDDENPTKARRSGRLPLRVGVQFASFAGTGRGRFGSRGKSVYDSITSWTFAGVRGESAK